jgi:hypothetical protein
MPGAKGIVTRTLHLNVLAQVLLFQMKKHLQEPKYDYKYPGFRDLQEREAGKADL